MLAYKPHIITITRLKEVRDANGMLVNTNEYEEIKTIKGQISLNPSSESITSFGKTVSNPAVLLAEIDDVAEDRNDPSLRSGDRILAISMKWNVESSVEFHESEPITSHARALLSRNLPDSEQDENV